MNQSSRNNYAITLSGSPHIDGNLSPDTLDVSYALGQSIPSRPISTVYSTSLQGFPLWVTKGMATHHRGVIACCPQASYNDLSAYEQELTSHYQAVLYTGFGTTGASVMAVRSSDAVIFGPGSMSSLLECTTAVQENKVIGIITGPWSIDNVLRSLLYKHYPHYPHVFDDTNPTRLLDKVMRRVQNRS